MIKRSELNPGKIFESKKGLRRKVTRWNVIGVDSDGYFGEIYYVSVSKDGKKSKEKSCWCDTFKKWADKEIPA